MESVLQAARVKYQELVSYTHLDVYKRQVLTAAEYIKKNYSQKLSLEEIAEQGGFNMNYFSELFKKETGKTFTAYVTDVRMEEAKKLLRDTDMPVYEVAGACLLYTSRCV